MPAGLKPSKTAPAPLEIAREEGSSLAPIDDHLSAFPNMRLFHDLRISVSEWSWVAQIARVLKDRGAIVEKLSLQTQAHGCAILCRVEGLSQPEAALAIAQIQSLDGTLSARIEHILLRR